MHEPDAEQDRPTPIASNASEGASKTTDAPASDPAADTTTDAPISADLESATRPWKDPKRLVLGVLGFGAGLALLGWVIHGAWPRTEEARAGWASLRSADPWLIAALLGCGAASAIVNGLSFQVTGNAIIAPEGRRLPTWDLQRLNLIANLLNYAPVRLGLAARVGWHMTVDRIGFLALGGWFAIIGLVLVAAVGAAFTATVATRDISLVWLLLLVAGTGIGISILKNLGGIVLRRHGRGSERILHHPTAIWWATLLRHLDVAAYWGRMAAAAAILGIDLSPSALLMLAIVAYTGSLAPFGRLGFREFLVASAAGWIGLEADALDANMQQLALLDSAGELIFYIVGGAACLPWYRRRLAAAAAARRRERSKNA